jgi:predicted SAM-dependent methyltransferase
MSDVAVRVENLGKLASLRQLLWRSTKNVLKTVVPRPYLLYAQAVIRAMPYIGLRYKCPCCGWHLHKLKPFGFHKIRENALCPRCGALERHRLMWLYLHHKTRVFADHTQLLHVAPERVLQQRFSSSPNIDYIAADIESPLARVRMDLIRMPCLNDAFDAILCSHVLEHIEDDLAAMRELHRVLRPGGWAILQVPIDNQRQVTYEDFSITSPDDRLQHFNQHDHVRIYGRDYKERLETAGFVVHVDHYVKELGPKKIKRYCLDSSEGIYVCRKPQSNVV